MLEFILGLGLGVALGLALDKFGDGVLLGSITTFFVSLGIW